ncbi:hypothetical protein RQP46_005140 [Phenoliferia psychrophenolica]
MDFAMSQPVAISVALVVLASAVLYSATRSGIDVSGLPPGPEPGTKLPKHPWLYFHELSKQYKSALITVWVGSTPYVAVTTARAAHDVMEKESNKTSGRPHSIPAQVLTGGLRIGVTTYNDQWRKLRKALHSNLTPKFAESYEPRQTLAADQLLKDIMADPENYREHLRTFAVTVIMAATYGSIRRVVAGLDRYGAAMVPGSYKVDYFPWLRFVPGYLAAPHRYHLEELGVYRDMYNEVRAKAKAGTSEACFVSYIMERQAMLGLSDPEAFYLAGSLFTGGADTTVSSTSTILLAALAFPDKLKVVQAELDRRSYKKPCGGVQSFPLPYPTRSIHRDPEIFEDGDSFVPERWLHTVGGVKVMNPAVHSSQFGYGRRVCPGQHVGDRSVYISTAKILWAFDITRTKDANGTELPLDIHPSQYMNAAVTHSLPYPATLSLRHPTTKKVLEGLEGVGA